MPKRPASNSPSAAIKAMVSAGLPYPEPPAHTRLREQDRPFWDAVVRARARDDWTGADLVVAVQLARTMRDIEVESQRLEEEGSVIENQKGTPVMNPRHAVLEQMARREMALMRALRMAGVPLGRSENAQNAVKIQAQAEQVREELENDSLLAL